MNHAQLNRPIAADRTIHDLVSRLRRITGDEALRRLLALVDDDRQSTPAEDPADGAGVSALAEAQQLARLRRLEALEDEIRGLSFMSRIAVDIWEQTFGSFRDQEEQTGSSDLFQIPRDNVETAIWATHAVQDRALRLVARFDTAFKVTSD